jgi:hypothetical protein
MTIWIVILMAKWWIKRNIGLWLEVYSRPDVMFSVCMCARYQASPRESHLTATKRILRYLKQIRDVGLWYPKGSKFKLIGYSDSKYGVARSIERAQGAHVNYLEDHLCHGPQRNKIVWQSLSPKPNMWVRGVVVHNCYGWNQLWRIMASTSRMCHCYVIMWKCI